MHANVENATGGITDDSVGKADFNSIYVSPDPRLYCATLAALDYDIPRHGAEIFSQLLPHIPSTENTTRPTIADVCSSYGFVGALCRSNLTLGELYAHYAGSSALTADELAEADRTLFSARQRDDAPRVVGIDSAAMAVDYGCRAGLLDAGFGENLEDDPISDELAKAISEVNLITTTGGVGYITDATFDKLLGACDGERVPWVASFVLRMYPYDDIAATLGKYGLVTEKLQGRTFVQRRFADDEERDYALDQLRAAGIDPSGKEADGDYHAEFFLSRPAADVAAAPLGELLG